jgi:PTH2 family peptidyl-tRNA hydrolase
MFKQVIVVRQDLKLDKGKLAVQVAHASLDAYKKSSLATREAWESEGSKKVVVRAESLKDAGKTQLKPGTVTCLGIGPDTEERLDRVTGDLNIL